MFAENAMSSVELDLDSVVKVLLIGVRRTAAFMGLGVNAAIDPDFKTVDLPSTESNLRLLPDPIPDSLMANIKEEFKLWIQAGGLRELCESLEQYLTGIYRFAAIAAASRGGRISSSAVVEIPKRFSREGLRTKLAMLREDFDVGLQRPELMASLWDVRNCLNHRRGLVGQQDVSGGGFLEMSWRGIDTLFIDHQGNVTLLEIGHEPFPTGEGGHIAIRVTDRVRRFTVGDRIDFSPHDLAEICWFALAQSDEIVKALMAHMERKGIAIKRDIAVDASTVSDETSI
jgi:hypothetical protein